MSTQQQAVTGSQCRKTPHKTLHTVADTVRWLQPVQKDTPHKTLHTVGDTVRRLQPVQKDTTQDTPHCSRHCQMVAASAERHHTRHSTL